MPYIATQIREQETIIIIMPKKIVPKEVYNLGKLSYLPTAFLKIKCLSQMSLVNVNTYPVSIGGP